jgi:hypothetical protein
MALDNAQQKDVCEVIKNCLRHKFNNYKPESNSMPFHFRLLGRDRMALYSFIHSLNTSFGTSIFEPVAVAIAKKCFKIVERQLFDLKTAKPNVSNFKDFKRTLLEWAGIVLTQNANAKVNTLIAIPYNPYEPEPYQRWTMKGMLDIEKELKVADEFWDFLGGEGTYNDLLNCFELAGIELRDEIDNYFSDFR